MAYKEKNIVCPKCGKKMTTHSKTWFGCCGRRWKIDRHIAGKTQDERLEAVSAIGENVAEYETMEYLWAT